MTTKANTDAKRCDGELEIKRQQVENDRKKIELEERKLAFEERKMALETQRMQSLQSQHVMGAQMLPIGPPAPTIVHHANGSSLFEL
jgi:hypothetical protein